MRFLKFLSMVSLVGLLAGVRSAHADDRVPADYAAGWLLTAVIASALFFGWPRLRAALARRARGEGPEEATFTDSVTGMQNRRYFDEALKEYLVQFDRIERPVGLMLIDLDGVETHGREAGDGMLREIATCLRGFTRRHDVVARLDGAQFAVLAPNMDEEAMTKFANRIREALCARIADRDGMRLDVSVSIGLAVWDNRETSGDFQRRVARLLEAAKAMGRNCVLSDPASAEGI